MLCRLILMCSLCSAVWASLAIAPLKEKPDKFKNEEGCYVSELDKMVKTGVLEPGEHCVGYICYNKYIEVETCGYAEAQPPCKVIEDKSKPYPDCCPQIDCPKIE